MNPIEEFFLKARVMGLEAKLKEAEERALKAEAELKAALERHGLVK